MLAAELAGRARLLVSPGGPRVMVAGLGNYGLWGTRHSTGMAVLDRLARQLAVAEGWRVDRRCCSDIALAAAHGLELVLLKPRRLMNLNGLSVASAAEIYSLRPEDIYLVHDDLDKALGKVAIKLGGSARGHNGVRSCISALHSNEMTRLRVGIGRPEGEVTVSSYVLAPFSAEEQERLKQVLAQAATCLLEHIQQRRALAGERGDRG
ncbi:probable peptidyl-tRNA hydrolase [Falco biarmicus]|uniref:probable peptidyl-tRNA hydrolase n=1 Tax=Falco rusticolus TaxID=120794 RepID=UPI001886626F|nr:probable peptidyl-tRNA hydrolase [Falco rusticolus]XP_055577055.1 probable peptidyl-tRNA hydrolase [Falco cherrug]XP_056208440.1 probable peptidyl-tRNA hydrolase [Falco biarmicus]